MNIPQPLVVGIDIGGTNTVFGLIDAQGNIYHHGSIATTCSDTVEGFLAELYKALWPILDKAGGAAHIKGIGIGAPNGNYYTGTVEYAPNLRWKGIVPLRDLVQQKFGLPVILTNDANAAAMGEMIYGAAKGMKDFIMITLGTGVGSGIVANGNVIYGHDGFAGELGHCVVIPNGRPHWATDLRGSLEAYASATGVVITARELLAADTQHKSLLHQIASDKLDSKTVYEAAIGGDLLAQEVFALTGKILGEAFANFVMFSSPEAIILFGGLAKAGDLLLQPIRVAMENNILPIFRNKVKLLFSLLPESNAAILGAGALVWGKSLNLGK